MLVRESRTCLQLAATLDSQCRRQLEVRAGPLQGDKPGEAVSLSRPAQRAVSAGASMLSAACARRGPSLYSATAAGAQVTYLPVRA